MRFRFIDEEKTTIWHGLKPNFTIVVLKLDRPNDYGSAGLGLEDIFDEIIIRGWHFCFQVIEYWYFEDLEDLSEIREILQSCAEWYKGQVVGGFVELDKYVSEEANKIMEDEKFKIQPSDKEGWWIVAHKFSSIIIEFKEGEFNTTQKISELGQPITDVIYGAKIMGEIGEWLIVNHCEKLF